MCYRLATWLNWITFWNIKYLNLKNCQQKKCEENKIICVIFSFWVCVWNSFAKLTREHNVNLYFCHRNNLLIGEQFILFDRNNHQQIDSILACANWIISFVCERDSEAARAAEYSLEIWVECRRRRRCRVCVLFVIQINYWCCNESYYMLKLIYNSIWCAQSYARCRRFIYTCSSRRK